MQSLGPSWLALVRHVCYPKVLHVGLMANFETAGKFALHTQQQYPLPPPPSFFSASFSRLIALLLALYHPGVEHFGQAQYDMFLHTKETK
jgi:hypothetical protein